MAMDLIAPNSMVMRIKLLRRRPWVTWITVWPFVIIYAIAFSLYLHPELVWDRVTYLVYQTYIDFAHATFVPLSLFFHGFLSLFTVWSIPFRSYVLFEQVSLNKLEEATHVFVVPHYHKGETEIVPLVQKTTDELPPCFIFQQRKWKWDAVAKQFNKPIFPTSYSFSHYLQWKGLDSSAEREKQLDIYGPNTMEVIIPEFTDLLVDHAFAPLFVFQMFCILLWCLDEYWYYSCLTGAMMVGMECAVVYQRINNMRSLRSMAEVPVTSIEVVRSGKVSIIPTTEVLPMDVVIVPSDRPFPVDALLIKGSVVVNEASLTGESTPQLKEAPDDVDITLSTKRHGRHMLFCGTHVLLSTGIGGEKNAVAVVLKNGFETKQGKLLRTILHSQGRVSENSREAYAYIGVLVIFALASAGFLLKRGLSDPSKNRWKLFLSCIQVITAVVPADLPLQLSLAVNNSLASLSKLAVFCTEPFRIPFAGSIDTCCFDKTGTLTTDEMLFGGIDMCDGKGVRKMLNDIPRMSEIVLISCHSLVSLEDAVIAGDEMEKAALNALGYRLHEPDVVVYDPPEKGCKERIKKAGETLKKIKDPRKTIKIRARFPFIAAFRRMACIVEAKEGTYVVVKGSPEAIFKLCIDMPAECLKLAENTAAKGFRVIALGYRRLIFDEYGKNVGHLPPREEIEKNLSFAGLSLYVCPLKKDARETICNLQEGSHRCVIITGDSVQTAIAVGRDVSLLRAPRCLVCKPKSGSEEEVEWYENDTPVRSMTREELVSKTYTGMLEKNRKWRFRSSNLPTKDAWELCVNAEILSQQQFSHVVKELNEYVAIWARCSPSHKEDIVMDLKKKNHCVMMAGDGTNDVGALKQAHVGIAVLNSTAVAKPVDSTIEIGPQPHNEPDLPAGMMRPPNFKFTVVPPKPEQTEGFMVQSKWHLAVAKRRAEIQRVIKWNAELEKRKKEKEEKVAASTPSLPFNGADASDTPSDFLMESLFNADDDGFGGPPMIKLGDASIAAPFTCRSKALTSVCDIIRLGRSTLVTTQMMYKILALNCLSAAYTMSVLASDGVKLGEKQMVVSGMILTVCFMCMARSKPLERLCPERPVTRIFHPAIFGSVFVQFALHLYCMVKTTALVVSIDSETVASMKAEASTEEFKPTLLNSVMFLMNTLQGGITFAVNYRGEPFMQKMRRNRPMFFALILLIGMVFYLAAEVDPEVNEMLEIVPFPSPEFRGAFLQLLAVDVVGSFLIEKFFLTFSTNC